MSAADAIWGKALRQVFTFPACVDCRIPLSVTFAWWCASLWSCVTKDAHVTKGTCHWLLRVGFLNKVFTLTWLFLSHKLLGAQANLGGHLGPALLAPKKKKSCSFQAILNKFWAQAPTGVKTPLPAPDQNSGSAPEAHLRVLLRNQCKSFANWRERGRRKFLWAVISEWWNNGKNERKTYCLFLTSFSCSRALYNFTLGENFFLSGSV